MTRAGRVAVDTSVRTMVFRARQGQRQQCFTAMGAPPKREEKEMLQMRGVNVKKGRLNNCMRACEMQRQCAIKAPHHRAMIPMNYDREHVKRKAAANLFVSTIRNMQNGDNVQV